MSKYKFRFLKPDADATTWIERENDISEIDAIQEEHLYRRCGALVKLAPGETVRFAIVETESGERLISRVFCQGIGRDRKSVV